MVSYFYENLNKRIGTAGQTVCVHGCLQLSATQARMAQAPGNEVVIHSQPASQAQNVWIDHKETVAISVAACSLRLLTAIIFFISVACQKQTRQNRNRYFVLFKALSLLQYYKISRGSPRYWFNCITRSICLTVSISKTFAWICCLTRSILFVCLSTKKNNY